MQAGWKSRSGWLVVVVALVAFVAAPRADADRAMPTAAQVGALDPAVADLEFRNLTVFSRGGRVTAVAGVPSNDQLYYMGSTGGGVWKTEDAGETWNAVSDGFFEAGSIGAIAVADADPNIVYVGTGSTCPRGNVSPGVGAYKSTDAGATWQHIGLREGGQIARVRVHPTNPNLVYMAVLGNMFGPNDERGVFRSTDGGASWEPILQVSNRTGAIDLTMDASNPDVMIAAMWTTERKPWTINSGSTEGGLFKTTDGGDTWRKLTEGLPTRVMVGRIGVSISAADSNRVYAQIEAGGEQGGTYRSDDGGETWRRTYEGRELQQRAWYYTHIHADPQDADTVYAQNTGFYRSTDGGETFQSVGGTRHGDHHDLWINPRDNTKMIESNDGGANVTVDGGGYWSTEDNQPTAEIYRLEVDTRWPYWVYGAQQDNSTIAVPSQGEAETYGVGGGESGYIAVDPRDYNIVYAGSYGGSLSRQDRKSGISESVRVYADSQTGQRAADMKYRQQWNAPIRISPHDPDVVYTTSQVVHRTRNGGLDWEVISPDLTRNDRRRQDYSGGEGITRDNTGVEVYSTIFAFEESPLVPGLLWAGSDDGLVHISRDNGQTWQNITPPGAPEGVVNAIDLSAHDPGRAHVAMYRYRQADFTPYIYRTNDYGQTWERIGDGTRGIADWHFVRVVREDPVRRGLLFAGTEFGLYASYDDGASWQRFQLNLPATPVTDMRIYRDDLVLTTQGRGFWILDNMSVVRGAQAGATLPAARLFKPEDAYRAGGQGPLFYYWFRERPTNDVVVTVRDPRGEDVFSITSPPGTPSPEEAVGGGGGRGRGFGRGGGGGGRGAQAQAGRGAQAQAAGRGGARGQAAGRGGQRGGGGGGGRGGRGGGGGAGGAAGAEQGLNRATWTQMTLDAPFQVPPGTVMWGGRGGGGPRVMPGTYTVTVSSGTWSASDTFQLGTDPRFQPPMTEDEGREQLDMALEIGGTIRELYDNIAKMRDAKSQAAERVDQAGQGSAVADAARTMTAGLEAVEGDMTQLQGSAGQDALNFPGRMDNQLVVLYQGIVGRERRLGSAVRERYADLKPQVDELLRQAGEALETEIAAFNRVATGAGLEPIVVR